MSEKILVEFVVDSNGAVRAVQTFTDKLNTEVPQAAQRASAGIGAMQVALGQLAAQLASAAFRGMTDFFRDSITAAAEEERVMQRLAVTVENSGVSWAAAGDSVRTLLAGIQDTTRFADDQAAGAFQTLIGITGDYNSSLIGLNATVTLAAGRNMDLEAASQLVGKAIAGNFATLSRYGIILSDTEKEMLKHATAAERAEFFQGKFNERFGGAAQADLRTASGQIDLLSNHFDDLKESVGAAINQRLFDPQIVSPLVELLDVLAANVGRVILGFQIAFTTIQQISNAVAAAIADHLAWITRSVQTVLNRFGDWLPGASQMSSAFGAVATSFSDAGAVFGQTALDMQNRLDRLLLDFENYETKAEDVVAATSGQGSMADSFLKASESANRYMTNIDRFPVGLYDLTRSQETLNQQILESGRSYISASNDGARYLTFLDDYAEKFGIIGGMPQQFPDEVDQAMRQVQDVLIANWEAVSAEFSDILSTSIAAGLVAAFSGDTEGVLDAFSSMVDQMAQASAQGLVDALGNIIQGGGSFGDLFSSEGGGWQMLGGLVGGGMLAQGQQRGNTTMGALGGAAAGAAGWGAAWSIPVYGWIGGIAATVLGGVMGYLSSQGQDTPETAFRLGPGGITDFRSANQGLDDPQRTNFARRAQTAYRDVENAYLQILRTFEDPELFGLLGALPTFATLGNASMASGSVDTWLQMLTSDILPDLFQTWASEALGAGLSGQGVSAEAQAALFEQLGSMSGSDRLQGLQDYVSAVVNSSKLLADLDWGAIQDEVGASSLEQFNTFITDTLDNIDVAMSGMGEMDLVSRARQAQSIEQMISQAREAEIQYLGQIRQLQEDISRSIASQIEGLRVGGMGTTERAVYYAGRVSELMGQLRGGQMSPEEVQQAVAQLQQYIQSISQLAGEDLYSAQGGGLEWSALAAALGMSAGGGQSIADYLIGLLGEADSLAQSQLEGAADQVATANDALIAELDRLREALGVTADGIFEAQSKSFAAADGLAAIQQVAASMPPPVVNVNIDGNISPLISMIQTVVLQTLAAGGSATGVS